MASVLVTGGCGFIGRHLVEALTKRGDTVRVLDLPRVRFRGSNTSAARSTIAPAVEAALDGVDCLYHLAGIAHLWQRDKDDFDRVNRARNGGRASGRGRETDAARRALLDGIDPASETTQRRGGRRIRTADA